MFSIEQTGPSTTEDIVSQPQLVGALALSEPDGAEVGARLLQVESSTGNVQTRPDNLTVWKEKGLILLQTEGS